LPRARARGEERARRRGRLRAGRAAVVVLPAAQAARHPPRPRLMSLMTRPKGLGRELGAAAGWGVLAYLLPSVRIQLPGPMGFHTDLTEVALLGSALFLRRPWLVLIACAIEALNVVSPATLLLSFETTFLMHAVAVPLAWYAHRALQRRGPSHLALGLAWSGFV